MTVYVNGIPMEVSRGPDYAAGDGIAIEGNEISVKTPVKYLTQAEYNTLSEEEKQAEALYLVEGFPLDAPGPGGNVYSTEETKIGTWIDGKPLYRKVFQGLISQTASMGVWYVLFSIQDAETVTNIIGKISQSIVHYYDNGIAWNFNSDNKTISLKCYIGNNFPRASDKYDVIVEYTKTTDETKGVQA